MTKEADLYSPVKSMLETKGYEVKAEVNGCDVVGIKSGAPVVIVELKLTFSLDLLLQGIDRQTITDDVYLAVAAPETPAKRKNWRLRQKGYLKLCRKLGVGLMQVNVTPDTEGAVLILQDPTPYIPRKNTRKSTKLITEFQNRSGDPNTGGVNRTKIMTAYRQNALRCAAILAIQDEMKVADIRESSGVLNAASILQKNYYEWFKRISRGVYSLTPTGHKNLSRNADVLPELVISGKSEDKH